MKPIKPNPILIPKVLSIAGSDSGGGAGIQADLKVITALGGFGMTAITAITAQNTMGVTRIQDIDLDVIEAQIDAVVTDIGVDVVKIGMLASPAIVKTVAAALKRHGIRKIVLIQSCERPQGQVWVVMIRRARWSPSFSHWLPSSHQICMRHRLSWVAQFVR